MLPTPSARSLPHILMLCLGLAAAGSLYALPATASGNDAPSLPEPTGRYVIGTLVVDWTDEMREETWTQDPDDHRRVVAQFWYPAETLPARVSAPYVLRHTQLRTSLDRFWKNEFPTVTTHAALEAPILKEERPWPVILLSHGMNSSRMLYTSLAEDLASHGYVVVTIDHPHWGPGVAFQDGETVEFDASMPSLEWLGPDRIDELVQEGISTMAEDQAFVARRLSTLVQDDRFAARELGRQLDLRRVGVMGHSMGGMAAVRAGFTYAPFKAIVTLDGYAWTAGGLTPHGSPAGASDKPLLVVVSASGVRGDSVAFARRHLDAFASPNVVRLDGTVHGSPTDVGLLSETHRAESVASHRRVARTVRAFFDEHLRYAGSFLQFAKARETVDMLDLDGILQNATRSADGTPIR